MFSVSLGFSAFQSVPMKVLAGPLGDVPCFMGHVRAENENTPESGHSGAVSWASEVRWPQGFMEQLLLPPPAKIPEMVTGTLKL